MKKKKEKDDREQHENKNQKSCGISFEQNIEIIPFKSSTCV